MTQSRISDTTPATEAIIDAFFSLSQEMSLKYGPRTTADAIYTYLARLLLQNMPVYRAQEELSNLSATLPLIAADIQYPTAGSA